MKLVITLLPLILVSCKSDEAEADDEKNSLLPEIVTYSGTVEEENEEKSSGVTTTIERKPAKPSDSLAKVIAANGGKPEAVPMDEVEAIHPVAEPIPGKPGYVFNPWTKKAVDVRGLASGTLTRDPADPDPSHQFRIP